MTSVAIVGAGPLGGAVAAAVALAGACSRVVIVDEAGAEAARLAQDVLEACSIRGVGTRMQASPSLDAASDADVLVVADRAADGAEWEGERALAMMARLVATNGRAPVLFAGTRQAWLMERAHDELRREAPGLLGSAALAFEAAARALTALEADVAAGDVTMRVAGRIPRGAVVLWASATIAGAPALERLDAAAVRRLEARLPALWPPAPFALGSAASALVGAMLGSSRRTFSCLTLIGPRPGALAWPVRLSAAGVADACHLSEEPRLRAALDA